MCYGNLNREQKKKKRKRYKKNQKHEYFILLLEEGKISLKDSFYLTTVM